MQVFVFVKPGSSQEKIVKNPDGSLTIFLHAGAHDGAANAALIKLLSKHFHVAKSCVTIIRGHTSRHKLIEISL